MKDLLSLQDYSTQEITELLELAAKLKKDNQEGRTHHLLKGKTLGMIFAKSSTRTRVSFEVGMYQLGGHGLFLSSNDIQLGRGDVYNRQEYSFPRLQWGCSIAIAVIIRLTEDNIFSDRLFSFRCALALIVYSKK